MIDLYIDFYNTNLTAIKQVVSEPYPVGESPYSAQYNAYSVLFDLCNDTKKEIEVLNTSNKVALDKQGNNIKQSEPIHIIKNSPEPQKLNLENCLAYINSIEDFEVLTELGRDNGKGLEDFIKMSRAVSFDDIGKGFDEVWEIGMKIKNENENLTILMKPVSIKEVLKIFVIGCKKQFELTGFDFLQWLDKKEFDWRKFQKDRVTEINTALESADSKRTKKLKQTKNEVIDMCKHHYKIMELLKNDVLNNAITPNAQPKKKKKTKKILSYKWQIETELPALWKQLTKVIIEDDNTFFAPDTTLEQVTAIFTGREVESIGHLLPVSINVTNRVFAYFFEQTFKGENWQNIAGEGKLFKSNRGTILTAVNLSNSKRGIKESTSVGYKKIDEILKEIKNI